MGQAQVPSFAKCNLVLRVLHKRPDQFHELRTIFQTVSIHDTLTVDCRRAKQTEISIDSSMDIPDNLAVRAGHAVLGHLGITARVHFTLQKRIPMGGGLGGGSSNAAAVLLTLPALLRKRIADQPLIELAETLGSDVPFFLFGGAAVGVGTGTELYPLPDLPTTHCVIVATGIHVSTPQAYRSLQRPTNALTSPAQSPILREFQTIAWNVGKARLDELPLGNDFEEAVFEAHPDLPVVVRKLRSLGANPVLMTGSGSAIFGVFQSSVQARKAAQRFAPELVHAAHFISRRKYQRAWNQALGTAAAYSRFTL